MNGQTPIERYALLDLVIDRGYDQRSGVRSLKRIIQRQLVLPLAMAIMERRIEPDQVLSIAAREIDIRVRIAEASDAGGTAEDQAPVRLADGRIVESGGPDLALHLEDQGYDWVREKYDSIPEG